MHSERLFGERNLHIESPEQYSPSGPRLAQALEMCKEAHTGQLRKSGEPFYTHPVAVLQIIKNELGIEDENMHIAALLHDAVEDNSNFSLEKIGEAFGREVREIVDGVTKADAQTVLEVDRKTIQKISKRSDLEPRVAILKLGDRLHNMRTLGSMQADSQIRKSRETLETFAPLAQSMGMWGVKRELEDLSFMYLYPDLYRQIYEELVLDPRLSSNFIAYYKSILEKHLADDNIPSSVDVRINGLWQLYNKRERMLLQGRTSKDRGFRDINDVVSFRVTAADTLDCYKALGVVQTAYGDIDNSRFDNFFGKNKRLNGYQALQVTRDTHEGAVEIAIATDEMEEFNSLGVVSLMRKGADNLAEYTLKSVFTENGEGRLRVHFLKRSATGIDLAYSINHAWGARVSCIIIDGSEMDPATVISNASIVEIILDENRVTPPAHFANFCLPETRNIINDQLRVAEAHELEIRGRQLASAYLAPRGVLKLEHIPGILSILQMTNAENTADVGYFYRMIATGAISENQINHWLDEHNVTKESLGITSIELSGADGPGVLSRVTVIIDGLTKNTANIDKIEQSKAGDSFYLLLVVTGLNGAQEDLLRNELSANIKFNSIKSLVV